MRTQRYRFGLSLVVTVALGGATQLAPGLHWVAHQLGGAFYVLMWIFLVLTVKPAWNPARVCAGALLATVLVEFAQLWHPAWLNAVRSTTPGHLLLGSTFSWLDFPYYLLGAGVGLVWTAWLARFE